MEEENKKVVEAQETEQKVTEETAVTEEKKDVAKKAKKAEKPSLAKRAKSAVTRNKKAIISGVGGFIAGVGAAIGGSMWLGHKHRKAEEEALRQMPMNPDGAVDYSPLDPNME